MTDQKHSRQRLDSRKVTRRERPLSRSNWSYLLPGMSPITSKKAGLYVSIGTNNDNHVSLFFSFPIGQPRGSEDSDWWTNLMEDFGSSDSGLEIRCTVYSNKGTRKSERIKRTSAGKPCFFLVICFGECVSEQY